MDISTLERDSPSFHEWRNRAFPFFRRKIFLNHAAVVPLPQAVVEAVSKYLSLVAEQGQFEFVHRDIYAECRRRVAALLGHGAQLEEVTFAGSTSHALGIVATSIDWKPGDNCVIADGDFPANVVTWLNLEHKYGVQIRRIPRRADFSVALEDLAPLVDERTRIVSLSSCNFLSGCPIDTNAIGKYLRARGVLFCLDSIQTLGAIPIDISHVDFVCADAHKWLLGPCGVAVLWVRQQVLETLRPAMLGWLSAPNVENFFAYSTDPLPTAERFSPGERNYTGVAGLNAALGMLEEVGRQTVASRVVELRNYAAQQAAQAKLPVLWMPDERRSGNVSLRMKSDQETNELYQKLDEKFSVSLRNDPEGTKWLRISPHFMNRHEDIDALFDEVRAFQHR